MLVYTAFNSEIAQRVPKEAKKILDVGCGNGALGNCLKGRQDTTVDGITYSEEEKKKAAEVLDNVWIEDLNSPFEIESNPQYDCIICSHVLEHLFHPWKVVAHLQQFLLPDGLMIIAIPNLLFFKQRLELLKGNFKYSLVGGPMDITHFRFFDWKTVDMLFEDAPGFSIVSKEATGMFPMPFIRKVIPSIGKKMDRLMTKNFPGLFGTQFIIVAQKNSCA